MIVYLQWAKAVPESWESYDLTSNAQVRRFARKAEPNANSALDQQPGWLVAANIQGVTVTGWDHVGVEVSGDLITLSCWNDDPDDWPVGERWGNVWTFLPCAPDYSLPGHLNGAMNTRQTSTCYADPGSNADVHNPGAMDFALFPYPDTRNVFHGIWVGDTLWAEHEQLQAPHGWREWII